MYLIHGFLFSAIQTGKNDTKLTENTPDIVARGLRAPPSCMKGTGFRGAQSPCATIAGGFGLSQAGGFGLSQYG